MTDERFTFIEDLRDKKRTAAGAYHKRTHCGKGGAVKFPSDFKTKKEIAAMSGEVKTYKLNAPMTWEEFKAMPSDIAITYIKALRDKYGVSDSKIFQMMGINQATGQRYIVKLGIGIGKGGSRYQSWDKDGWYSWVNGVPAKGETNPSEGLEKCVVEVEKPTEKCEVVYEPPKMYAPHIGSLTFEGKAAEALATVALLLGEANVRLSVTWEGM